MMRSVFLGMSTSAWMRERATKYGFVKRAVRRFMPGETAESAIAAAGELNAQGIGVVLTQLGENVTDRAEAEGVRDHYLGVLEKMRGTGLDGELSVKLTQLGLDLDAELCTANVRAILERETPERVVWVDMESSGYVDRTLEVYARVRREFPNVGVCVQAYLRRTAGDVERLIGMGAAVRLVKGAYQETAEVAFPVKRDVDENYFALAKELMGERARAAGVRAAFATHDMELVARIVEYGRGQGRGAGEMEFQMLYGIGRGEQLRLAGEGSRMMVLISYGSYWFPWYMRRLAERPANAWFVVRQMMGG